MATPSAIYRELMLEANRKPMSQFDKAHPEAQA